MDNNIRYSDLWILLRKLGFNCDKVDEHNHRVCEFAPADARIVLHDYPSSMSIRSEILIGVRLQLDNAGVMSRADFDHWAARRVKRKATVAVNGRDRAQNVRKV